jgi:hypothetical protein
MGRDPGRRAGGPGGWVLCGRAILHGVSLLLERRETAVVRVWGRVLEAGGRACYVPCSAGVVVMVVG